MGLTPLTVALPTLAATERKCCDVRLRDAAGSFTAGGGPATVTATVAATRRGCTNVRPRLTVRLAGLDPDEIRVERVIRGAPRSLPVRPAGAGAVQALDPVPGGLRLCGDGRANLAYRLTFLAGSPTGRATLSAEAGTPSGRVLGRAATATVVLDKTVVPPRAKRPRRAAPPAAPVPSSAVDSPITTAPAPAADGPSTAPAPAARRRSTAPAQLSPALTAAGLGAVVAATVAMVAVLALRSRRREVAPHAPAAGAAGAASAAGTGGPAGSSRRARQPTLSARWSSLVATVRRPLGPVAKDG